jgi:hypothetical protein
VEGREGGTEGRREDLLISTFEFWDFVKFQSGAANKVRTLLLLLCFLLLARWMGGCFYFRSACVCRGLWNPSFWYLVGDEGEGLFCFWVLGLSLESYCVFACLEMWRGTMGFADGWIDGWVADFFCVTASFALAVLLENQKEQDPVRNS